MARPAVSSAHAAASDPPFAHLAAVSSRSLRHGALRPQDLATTVAERGMRAVGVCDRDGLLGVVPLARACQDAGVTLVPGVDLALAPDPDRPGWQAGRPTRRPASGPAWLDEDPARVRLLARSRAGYARLCRLVSAAHGHDADVPRARWDDLARWVGDGADGDLVVLLGDDAPTGRLLAAGRPDAARDEARRWADLAGRAGTLVGITHHRARGDDARARAAFALADDLGLPPVADQRPRYRDPDDARLVDVLDAIRAQAPLAPRHRGRRNAEGYLKDPAAMAQVFAERPDALANAGRVAADAAVDLDLGRLRVPDLAETPHADPDAALRARCEAGLAARYAQVTTAHRDRLDDELAMTAHLGLASYFLSVAAIVDRIRAKDMLVACRGSAAGSLVTYCLGISDVDPIRHDLCFERFMNPYRDELPDIDLDVESARRTEVYQDVVATYGSERVAGVTMLETFKARLALREVGKALGLPAGEVDVIAKAFPRVRAGDVPAALEHLPELRGANLRREDLASLFDLATRLDGLPRHVALHPSGVLLAPAAGDPGAGPHDGLRDLVATQPSAEGFPMAQVDKDDVEVLGLCKLDVLGVRLLSAMRHAVDEARRVRGVALEPDALPVDDPDAYALIRSTRTLGIFQVESPGQRELVGRLEPATLEDLVVDISLFRPGPVKSDMVGPFLRRRHGSEPVTVAHPALTPVLAETHGVIVFHEQVMRCVAAVTGCDLSTADLVRRRLGDPTEVEALRAWIVDGARRRGMGAEAAAALWEALAQFASFGFCKAHAAAFAVPTARSAWLKAHHLPELVAGLLAHDPGMYPRRALLADARQLGVAVLPVDVNRSGRHAQVEAIPDPLASGAPADPRVGAPTLTAGMDLGACPDRPGWRFGVRPGLADVAGIDEAMIASLRAGQPFASLADLRARARLDAPVAEALAHVGALDDLAPGRSRRDVLLETAERWGSGTARGRGSRRGRERSAPSCPPEQPSLLGPEPPPGLPDYTPAERVRAELEVLGLDGSAHVLDFYRDLLAALGTTRAADLREASGLGPQPGGTQRTGRRVRVAGAKVATQTPPVRSGQRVIFLSLDDGTGLADAALFEAVHDRCAATVFHSWLLAVEGRVVRAGRRGVSLVAERAWDLRQLRRAWREGWLADALADAPATPAATAAPTAAAPPDPAHPAYDAERLAQERRRAADPDADPASLAPRRLWHASGGSAG